MKLSNERILRDMPKLSEIIKKQLPVKVSYAIAKNIAKIEAELNVYNKEREKLIEKYAVKDEQSKTIVDENNQISIKEEHIKDWNRDIKELLSIENEVDIHKFSIDALEGYSMTPAELMIIDYMIEE
jgi:hypothetical protein